jgi:hypothetical protein
MARITSNQLTSGWTITQRLDNGFIRVTDVYPPLGEEVRFIPDVPECYHPNKASVTIYRNMIKVKQFHVQPPHLAGVNRGQCKYVFGGKPRKRMLEAFNAWRIPKTTIFFLHLTYPSEFPLDWRVWKHDLDKWKRRLLRRFPTAQGIWKLELQRRGAPHYHMLIAFDEFVSIEDMREWNDKAWADIAHRNDQYHGEFACRVEFCFSVRHAMNYAAKYCTKPGDVPVFEDDDELVEGLFPATMGRHWGKVGKVDCSRFEDDSIYAEEISYFRVNLAAEIKKRGAKGWYALLHPKTRGSFTIFGLGAQSDDRFPMAGEVIAKLKDAWFANGGWKDIRELDEEMHSESENVG